ncbi:hypothetical protein AWM79_06435 [Pseudomonas agarici]|uniref:Uncharacterized protein n=1 Tax=Pseudomonas agarici TaxID=46677 RepID=A0A0X1SYQ6_PSEAA|nr:hypothetical protein [Pseudomonas agarici]AMB84966.1 hypothetical protein AWM79_06435 [Pseudomonas agarici]NWB93208.1 hypothetical protein [Pseudomonas agarici]NWC08421.1 hypothetical protein [Pseudomonas agarici]SEK66321.1 hypothetical protein SAMN05216604_10596 [Pseudomonas agarici]
MQSLSFIPVLASLVLLGACKTHLEPVAYSADYLSARDANGRAGLIPVECQKPPRTNREVVGDEPDLSSTLPLGCANNLNLLQMVEQRQDLVQGRSTGPTMAAPVGRAAQIYIEGQDRQKQERREAVQEAQTSTGAAQ